VTHAKERIKKIGEDIESTTILAEQETKILQEKYEQSKLEKIQLEKELEEELFKQEKLDVNIFIS
jgi:hypothetical protein